ncbi:hypothetical protein Tco_1309906 [Tanacetum coccineum]
MELRKKRLDNYMWTTTNRLKPKPITDVRINPNLNLQYSLCIDKMIEGTLKFITPSGKRYERLNKIPKELGIQSTFPAHVHEQASSQLSGRKIRRMKLEPDIQPEYGMFFIDVFRDEAFQRMSDINKVGIETLLTYLVMASNITTPENARFCLKLRKLIADHPDQEKLKSKKVKVKPLG